jgi:hypothetical protein
VLNGFGTESASALVGLGFLRFSVSNLPWRPISTPMAALTETQVHKFFLLPRFRAQPRPDFGTLDHRPRDSPLSSCLSLSPSFTFS